MKNEDIYSIIEKARRTGKIEKGTNEVTKAIILLMLILKKLFSISLFYVRKKIFCVKKLTANKNWELLSGFL